MKIFKKVPLFEKEGLDFFITEIKKSKCYLEYGCGGSTIFAADCPNIKSIISIDTDHNFIKNVKTQIYSTQKDIFIQHCDLGPVGKWGYPLTKNQINNFWQSSILPWKIANIRQLRPDIILIDGRFRISCFLFSLISGEPGTRIIFDDYFNRPKYHIVENYCKVYDKKNRMALFVIPKNKDFFSLIEAYSKYLLDWT